MTVIHGSYSFWQCAVIGLWFFLMKAMAADLSSLEQLLGEAVLDALEGARITVKEAAAIMKVDESTFTKALRGEGYRHISLNHLVKLPFSFWLRFSPSLTYLVAKKNTQEIAETFGLRKVG